MVDDSALFRQSLRNVLRGVGGTEVVGVAKDGIDALAKIESLDPDLLTLDVEMPGMNGIQLLREVKRRRLRPKAIMVSSFTSEGAQVTTDALMEGAFDFILKPSGGDLDGNRQRLHDSLDEKIAGFRASSYADVGDSQRAVAKQDLDANEGDDSAPVPRSACEAVIIGTSTGGPEALKTVLPKLPAELSVPVLVVQHMPAKYTLSLAARLNQICELEVIEATDRVPATAGKVIMAAGGTQMKMTRKRDQLIVQTIDDPPENGVRPSVDYLLRSVVRALGGNALAVIMTGMGRDGLKGCRELKDAGGYVFAQSQSDSIVYGMPKAVVDERLADRKLRLGKIAPAIVRHVKRSRRS